MSLFPSNYIPPVLFPLPFIYGCAAHCSFYFKTVFAFKGSVVDLIVFSSPLPPTQANSWQQPTSPPLRDPHIQQPAAPPGAPSNQVNGIHFTDVIKKTNYRKLVIYHPHEDHHTCPGTSPSVTESVSPPPSDTASSVRRRGWTLPYNSHSLPQSDSHTVGHLWECLVWVIKAQCSADRGSEEKRRTVGCD